MKNTIFKKAVIFSAFFFAFFEGFAQGGSQSPVAGIGYAPANGMVIKSQQYKGRNGVAVWTMDTGGALSNFVRNDSVFIVSGTDTTFSGSDILIANFGNIFFVSEGGDNSTAVVGSLARTWADPWAAIDTAQAGDLVYIFPGTYTTATSDNLWKDGVTMYFAPEAIITQRPTITTAETTLFYCNVPGSMNIYGGKFDIDNYVSDYFAIIDTSGVNFNVFNAQYVAAVKLIGGATDANINISSVQNSTSLVFHNSSGGKSGGIKRVNAILSGSMEQYLQSTIYMISDSSITNINVSALYRNINVDYLGFPFLGTTPERGFFSFSSGGTALNDVNVDIDIQKGYFGDENINRSVSINVVGMNNLLGHQNLKYSFDCQNCILNGTYPGRTLSLAGSNRLRFSGANVSITGNYFFENQAVIVGNGGAAFDANTSLIFNGNFYSDSLFVDSIATGIPIQFSGNYTTNTVSPAFAWTSFTANANQLFDNAIIENKGSGGLFQIPSATYLNGQTYYLSSNKTKISQVLQSTETYNTEFDADSLRVTYLTNGPVYSTSTGALYTSSAGPANIYNADDALTANRTVTGANFNLQFSNVAAFRANGAGTANWRFDFFPNSSLPSILEQTVGTDTANVEFIASLGRSILKGTQEVFIESPYLAVGTLGDYVDYPATQAASPSFWQYNTDGTGQYKAAQNGVAFDTTDGSGDITISFAENMPDATFTALCIPDSVTGQYANVQSKTNSSVTVRIFDSGGAVVSTGVIVNWSVTDY